MATTDLPGARKRVRLAGRFAPAVGLVALMVGGLWFFGAMVTNSFAASTALSAVWIALLGAAVAVVSLRRRSLLVPLGGTFAVAAAILGAFFAWATLVDKTVDEDVVVASAAPAASPRSGATGKASLARGRFVGLAHATSGTAAVVELPGGARKLTLTNLDTDAGPDLRVYLAAGPVDEGRARDHVDLGALKGNKGTQQYDVPVGVDVAEHATVVIWCRAFSVAFGKAVLAPT